LVDAGIQVAAITGNHDSEVRVTVYNELLDRRVHLRGGYEDAGHVITLDLADGPLDLVLLPFLEPLMAAEGFGADGTDGESNDQQGRRQRRTHESVLRAAADTARSHLGSPRSLCLAHAFVSGGTECESERQLTVGGTSVVPLDVFDGFSYSALGHLHRPQRLSDTVRYSGTPLAYSFSEDHQKSVLIVDMEADGSVAVAAREVPVGRHVVTIEGTMQQLLNDDFADASEKFVRARITDTTVIVNPRGQLEQRFPHLIEISQAAINNAVEHAATMASNRSPFDTTLAFWQESTGSAPSEAEHEALRQALEAAEAVAQ
jgi:exonuclease SbcD